jgi:hypothetical protein
MRELPIKDHNDASRSDWIACMGEATRLSAYKSRHNSSVPSLAEVQLRRSHNKANVRHGVSAGDGSAKAPLATNGDFARCRHRRSSR